MFYRFNGARNGVEMTGADLSGVNLENAKYDQFTLLSLTRAKMDGTLMSDDLARDLEKLMSF